jgi:hypothetical protein
MTLYWQILHKYHWYVFLQMDFSSNLTPQAFSLIQYCYEKSILSLNDNVYFFIRDIKNLESTFGHGHLLRNQNILPGCIYSIQSLCIGLNIPEAHLPVVMVRFFKHSTYWLVHGIKALRPSGLPTQLGCRSGHGLHDVSPGLHRFCS